MSKRHFAILTRGEDAVSAGLHRSEFSGSRSHPALCVNSIPLSPGKFAKCWSIPTTSLIGLPIRQPFRVAVSNEISNGGKNPQSLGVASLSGPNSSGVAMPAASLGSRISTRGCPRASTTARSFDKRLRAESAQPRSRTAISVTGREWAVLGFGDADEAQIETAAKTLALSWEVCRE